MRNYTFAGGVAVVTGAASGIGRALALDLAGRGSHLVLLDRDGAGLAAVRDAVREVAPALRIDLTGQVGVTTVLPGGVATRFAPNASLGAAVPRRRGERVVRLVDRLALRQAPEEVAGQVLDGVRRRRPRVLVGATADLPDLFVRLAPGGYTTVMGLVVRAGRVVLRRG
jgi:short-subunit dehydrogenase